jgi:hypothetical protein
MSGGIRYEYHIDEMIHGILISDSRRVFGNQVIVQTLLTDSACKLLKISTR